jgi:hypothetical protein
VGQHHIISATLLTTYAWRNAVTCSLRLCVNRSPLSRRGGEPVSQITSAELAEAITPRLRRHMGYVELVLNAAREASSAGERGGGLAFQRAFVESVERQMNTAVLSLEAAVIHAEAPPPDEDSAMKAAVRASPAPQRERERERESVERQMYTAVRMGWRACPHAQPGTRGVPPTIHSLTQ